MPSLNTGNAILSNAITVDGSYNVGIGGAANASYKLQVTGTTNLTGALSGTSATFNTNSTSNAGFFQINDSTTTLGNSFATVQRNANDGNGRFSLSRWQVQNTSGLEQSAFIGAQAVTGASNYSPNLILGVSNGASSYTTYLTIASTGAATFSSSVTSTGLIVSNTIDTYPEFITTPSDADVFLGFTNTGDGNNAWGIGRRNTGDFWITSFTGNFNSGTRTTRLAITSSGNVGIGTSSPDCLLQAKGIDSLSSNTRYLKTHVGGAGTWGANAYEELGIGFSGIRSIYTSGDNWDLAFSAGTSTTFAAGTQPERMRITSGGNIGIGNTGNSGIRVYIYGQTSDNSTQAFNVSNSSGTNLFYARNDGYLYSIGAWSGSDIRLKENITDLNNGLQKVLGLKAKKFDLINGLKNNYGFIAQEMQEVIPDAVSVFEEKEQLLAVRMDYIIPHLVKAIQEQQAMIEAQQQQINQLINK